MARNILTKVVNVVSIAIIIVSVLLLISVVMTKAGDIPSVGGYSFLRVMTGSMEPEIPTDSLIVVKSVEPSEIQEEDIISFFFYEEGLRGQINTHRVTAIDYDGEHYIYTTKGDANVIEDQYTTIDTDLLGKVVFVSHIFGILVRLTSNPLVFFPLIVIPLFIMMGMNIVSTIRSTKEIARQEEEEEIRKFLEELKNQNTKEEEESDN